MPDVARPVAQRGDGWEFETPGGGKVFVRGDAADRMIEQYERVHGPQSVDPGASEEPPTQPAVVKSRPRLGQTTVAPPQGPPPEPLPEVRGAIQRQDPLAAMGAQAQERALAEKLAGGKLILRPGRPAVDPEAYGATPEMTTEVGGYVPRGITRVTEAGPAPDPEYLARMREIDEDERRLAKAERFRATAEAHADTARAQADAADYWLEAQQKEADLEKSRQRVEQDEQEYQSLVTTLRERKIDPDRFWAERGIFGGILAAVAQGIGAYAATIAGTPNFAQNIIDNAIARDMMAQERELDQLGMRCQNALAILDRHYRNREQARVALERAKRQQIEAQRAELVAKSRVPQVQLAYQQFLIDQQKQEAERERQFKALAAGKVREQESFAYMKREEETPAAAYRRPLTAEETAEEIAKTIKRMEDIGVRLTPQQRQQVRMAEVKAQQTERVRIDAETRKGAEKIGVSLSKQALLAEAVEGVASKAGLERGPDGTWQMKGWNVPGMGMEKMLPMRLTPQVARQVRLDAGKVTALYVREISGAQASDKEREFLQLLNEGVYDSDFVAGLNGLEQQAAARQRALEEAYGPDATALARERAARVRELRAKEKKEAPPAPTPKE